MLASNQERLQTRFNGAHLKSRLKRKVFLDGHVGVIRKGKKISAHSRRVSFFRGKKKERNKKSALLVSKRKRIDCTTIYIQSTHNNTIYTLAGSRGETRCCVPAGMCGFKNTRKSTSYASQAAAEKLAALAKDHNITHVCIKMRGVGPGKLSGVRALHQSGFRIRKISECTTLPHNGCRPPKLRRI